MSRSMFGVIVVAIAATVAPAACGATTHPAPGLPAIVNGVPLRSLAKEALTQAAGWSDLHPTHVRVAVSASTARSGTPPHDVYTVSLDGRFTCAPAVCDSMSGPGPTDSAPSSTSTSPTTTVASRPLRYLTFTSPLSRGGTTRSLSVSRIKPNLARFGRIYNLDPYVAQLEKH